jgi:glycosyltransferase involved in cell wall biosynthesis
VTRPPQVAHVTTAHPHLDNRIFRKECVSLAEAGLDVRLVAVAAEDEVVDGVPVIALPFRRGRARRMLVGPFDAWRALRRLQPGMIHVHDPELIPLAVLWRAVHRRPAVYDAHEDLPKQVAGKQYIPLLLRRPVALAARLLEGAADRWLDAVVAATPAISRNYRRAPVVLVQNFPWLRDFPDEPAPAASEGARQELTLSYVGGITRERGGLEMLRAVGAARQPTRLVLAGAASSEMRREIEADSSGRVRYLGLLPVDRVPGVVAESDVGLVLFHPLPNHLECQPTKLFEYMAAGKPFIASNFAAWQELLGEFDCGYFIDPTDPVALQAVIDRIASCPAEARARGVRARRALVERFVFEGESERLVGLTRRLLASRHPGAPGQDPDGATSAAVCDESDERGGCPAPVRQAGAHRSGSRSDARGRAPHRPHRPALRPGLVRHLLRGAGHT